MTIIMVQRRDNRLRIISLTDDAVKFLGLFGQILFRISVLIFIKIVL